MWIETKTDSFSGTIVNRISNDTFILKRPRNYTYYKEFPFLLERKRNHIEYFHCIQRKSSKCKARLVIKRFSQGNDQITQLKEHNHELVAGIWWIFTRNSNAFSLTFPIFYYFFQIIDRFFIFNIKDFCFLDTIKRVTKRIGDAVIWLTVANDAQHV